jgi:hypothetical protein
MTRGHPTADPSTAPVTIEPCQAPLRMTVFVIDPRRIKDLDLSYMSIQPREGLIKSLQCDPGASKTQIPCGNDKPEKLKAYLHQSFPRFIVLRFQSHYTLNLKNRMSPSFTTYSLPSERSSPASFTACSLPRRKRSSQA